MTTRKFWKYNNRHGTFKKFKRTVMLFMIVPVLLFNVFSSMIYSSKLRAELNQKTDVAYAKTVQGFEKYFAESRAVCMSLGAVDIVRRFMTTPKEEFEENIWDFRPITELIKIEYQRSDCIDEIALYSPASGYIISNRQSGYAEEINPKWYQYYKDTGEVKNVFSERSDYNGGRSYDYITLTRPITFASGVLGVAVIRYSNNQLRKLIALDEYQTDVAVRLTYNPTGEELFNSGEIEPYETRTYNIVRTDTEMTFIVGEHGYYEIVQMVCIYVAICLLLCLLVAYLISVFCAKILFNSVTDIIAKIDSPGENEISNMSQKVLSDMNSAGDVESELAGALNKLQAAQMNSLRLQITPHFIFNVLNCINIAILQKSENDATTLVKNLSDILQYTMQEPKYSARVKDEIETTKKYIEIERIKLDGELEAVWKVGDDILSRRCTKLFLQPIVENAVMHGIKNLEGKKGRIEIAARAVGEDTIFTVTDNGVGMTPDKLRKLRKQLGQSCIDDIKHIGLRNVNERIKLVYGEKYGVSIDSDKTGTKVTIKIGGGVADEAESKQADDISKWGGGTASIGDGKACLGEDVESRGV